MGGGVHRRHETKGGCGEAGAGGAPCFGALVFLLGVLLRWGVACRVVPVSNEPTLRVKYFQRNSLEYIIKSYRVLQLVYRFWNTGLTVQAAPFSTINTIIKEGATVLWAMWLATTYSEGALGTTYC